MIESFSDLAQTLEQSAICGRMSKRCDYCRRRWSNEPCVILNSGIVMCLECYEDRQNERDGEISDIVEEWASSSESETDSEQEWMDPSEPAAEPDEPEEEPNPENESADPPAKRQRY